ncbi:MAG: HD-GYP domain-containing protein [Planctomycetota bacterium]
MSVLDAPSLDRSSPLGERLAALGVPACAAGPETDSAGRWVHDAPGREALEQSPGFVEAWGRALAAASQDHVVTVLPGLEAVWLEPRGDRGPRWLAPIVTPSWIETQPSALREALSPLAAHGWADASAAARWLGWACEDLRAKDEQSLAIEQFSDKLLASYEEATLVYRFARLMNWENLPLDTVQIACGQVVEVLPFRWVAIAFGDAGVVPGLAGQRVVAGDVERLEPGSLEDVCARLCADPQRQWSRVLEAETLGMRGQVDSEVLLERICVDDKPLGVILAGDKTDGDPEITSGEVQLIDAISEFLGIYHANTARHAEQAKLFGGTMRALSASIDAKDPYTRGHSDRVALIATQLAEAAGLEPARVQEVRLAGLLHDVGKIGVPEAVLCSVSRLSDDEFALIKQHPVIGHDILKDIPQLEPMLGGVRSHHERWDGRGYPDGLAGEDIPLYARILAYADTFDAMRSNRSYRKAIAHVDVMAEIAASAGTQLDPGLATAFSGLNFAEFERKLEQHARDASWGRLSA